ncbi:MAG: type II toxin-antitoxin system HicB family antitoxin [Planctomycetota bacterium]|jgi:predicted RNase H-like HicB family nuclease|nr:type II toxin-antitoxin system HicB family antitoxin [Planctomycetota bacterium]
MAKKYLALVELEKEIPGDVLGVVFPDLPGCISCGDTYDEALRNAEEALAGHWEDARDRGELLPPPRPLAQIENEWEDFPLWQNSRYAAVWIDATVPQWREKYEPSLT